MNEVEIYDVGVEDIEPNHWVAYILKLPGCFSSGRKMEEARAKVPEAMRAYQLWVLWNHLDMFEVPAAQFRTAEVFYSYPSAKDSEYIVNAFFEDDVRQLSLADVQAGIRLLECTRADLLKLIKDVWSEKLNKPIPGDTRFGSIAGILKHLAVAEWWYCDRLGLVEDWSLLPEDPLEALEVSRANTVLRLPELTDDARITEHVGERWSGRKLLRRALWHERDHTEHIRKLLGADH